MRGFFGISSLIGCILFASTGQAHVENPRDEIHGILASCRGSSTFGDQLHCLRESTNALLRELNQVKARQLQTIVNVCHTGTVSKVTSDKELRDEVACIVVGFLYAADDRSPRNYITKMCTQTSFYFHVQCLFAAADSASDALLKSTINRCRNVIELKAQSQCLIDGLVRLMDRSEPAPVSTWWRW